MKKRALSIVAIMSLVVLTSAISVYAQSQRTRIEIPFSFVVNEKVFPAGEYTVEPAQKDSRNVLLLRSENGKNNIVFITISVRASQIKDESSLVFHKYDNQYFLAQVWDGGDPNGRQLRITKQEQNVMLGGIPRETITITRGSESGN